MTVLAFSLPVPPSTNNLYVNARGKRVKSKQYADWITDAGWAAKTAVAGKERCKAPYLITYEVPTDKRRDLDNYLKAANDLLVRVGIIPDDSLIDSLSISRADRSDMGVIIAGRAA